METENYIKACKVAELKEGVGKRVYLNDEEIAIFKVEGIIYALNNTCPHQQARKIHEGFIEDHGVVCPLHGWKFDLATGNIAPDRRGLKTYPVKIENGFVFVNVIKKELSW